MVTDVDGSELSAEPNVLVIMSDEHQARALGCAGHPVVQTPHLDELAANGTRFTNTWTPSPICVPARASFATGRWVHDIGAWDSVQAYAGTPPGWSHAMAATGRDVVSFGKLHHRSAADDDGFTHRVLPMFIAGGVGWLQGLARHDPLDYPEAAELAEHTGSGETTYTKYDRLITDRATDWIRGRRNNQQPWVAFVSFVAPHYPLSAPTEFMDLYPRSEVPPPEIPSVVHDHPAVAAMQDFFDYDTYFDRAGRKDARRAYYALCSFMDHNVGQVLQALEDSDQRDNTRVIYTSDHGELLGNRGLWCKSFMYRDSVDVPLIVAGPGMARGHIDTREANLIDIASTITETAGLTSTGSGSSLWADPLDRPGFSEYHDGGSVTGSFAIRTGGWKYIHHEGFAPQLFNVEDDPDELVDRAGDAAVSTIEQSYAAVLRDILDPTEANRAAFASQAAIMDAHGGRQGVADAFRFNHTPAPSD
ncbi:MAG: sulfatase-like hydrolase/transferase [Acidimicrobiales bacterium]|nr:sulfatase-like hydrolase/transferase [Acidimicrobiales bacterium]